MKKVIVSAAVFFSFVSVAHAGEIFFSDGFESNSFNNVKSTNGTKWGVSNYSSVDNVSITSEKAHSGKYALKFFYKGNSTLSDDAWAEKRFSFGTPQKDVHISYYIYFSENYSIRSDPNGPSNTKLGVFWGEEYSDPVTMAIEYGTDMQPRFKTKVAGSPKVPTCSGSTGYVTDIPGVSTSIDQMRGKWTHIEYRLKVDTGSGNGAFQMWVNGVKEVDAQNVSWGAGPCSPGYLKNGYLMGWSNSGFNQDTVVYIDDVVFSTGYVSGAETVAAANGGNNTVTPPPPSGLVIK